MDVVFVAEIIDETQPKRKILCEIPAVKINNPSVFLLLHRTGDVLKSRYGSYFSCRESALIELGTLNAPKAHLNFKL